MRREWRGGDYFGARPTLAKVKDLINEVVRLFGEDVEIECVTVGRGYYVKASTVDDLVSELDNSVRLIKNLEIRVKCSHTDEAEALLHFGAHPGASRWHMRWLLFPYRMQDVSSWSVKHPDAAIVERIAREIRDSFDQMATKLWRFKSGISKWHALVSIPLLSVAGGWLAHPWHEGGWGDFQFYFAGAAMILYRWLVLVFDYRVEIRVRPPAIASFWTSWNPSNATVARSTVLATVLAVPALVLALVQLFQG
ncbi:hypothetical protein [Streptomyces sp. NPDC059850]|uniref:hypothetical protein n=1 Tax=Streptomyces sp. NPDC059850 TaxID=3346970 RepID=UPI00364C207E